VVRLVAAGSRFGGNVAGKVASMPKRALPFYQSAEWVALVKMRKLSPDYEAAKARRKYQHERLVLDHIAEMKDGGAALDPANTQWLTHSEHQAKTAMAKRKRVGLG